MTIEPEKIIQATRKWVETVVIDLNLCPFARQEVINNRVRFAVTASGTEEALLLDLHDEMKLLMDNDEIETTLLIVSDALVDFGSYNQFLGYANDLIREMHLEGVLQIASFHPQYQFAGTAPDDVENYTNRSPYPVLHLLREESLEKAIASHPDTAKIPERNQVLLRDMGVNKMKALLRACLIGSDS